MRCPACFTEHEQWLQFKFGDTWQLDYELGDRLRWGGNDVGRPGHPMVMVSAVGEGCPTCHRSGEHDFLIEVVGDLLTAVHDAPDGPPAQTDGAFYTVVSEGE